MLPAFTWLLIYQTVGEIIAHGLELPVPGPVIGMLMLFATLVARGQAPDQLRDTANGMLTHLSLLFVPAGVGVMIHVERLSGEALPIVVSLILSTVLVVCTGITGAVLAKYVLDALRIADHAVRGFAVGVAAHGIGTARAFQVSEEAGAFAGLATGLNGAITALMVPLAFWLLSNLA